MTLQPYSPTFGGMNDAFTHLKQTGEMVILIDNTIT